MCNLLRRLELYEEPPHDVVEDRPGDPNVRVVGVPPRLVDSPHDALGHHLQRDPELQADGHLDCVSIGQPPHHRPLLGDRQEDFPEGPIIEPVGRDEPLDVVLLLTEDELVRDPLAVGWQFSSGDHDAILFYSKIFISFSL
jgi:hypothetical protein